MGTTITADARHQRNEEVLRDSKLNPNAPPAELDANLGFGFPG